MLSSIAAVFLSTFPVWGATIKAASYKDDQQGFLSTFPVWGATYTALRCLRCTSISIHVPRVGSDPLPPAVWPAVQLFLSTFPVWGATGKLSALCAHSLYFYPRSPCGERQQKQREKSLLLFHYKTLCTNLEELLSGEKAKTGKIMQSLPAEPVRRSRGNHEGLAFAQAGGQGQKSRRPSCSKGGWTPTCSTLLL